MKSASLFLRGLVRLVVLCVLCIQPLNLPLLFSGMPILPDGPAAQDGGLAGITPAMSSRDPVAPLLDEAGVVSASLAEPPAQAPARPAVGIGNSAFVKDVDLGNGQRQAQVAMTPIHYQALDGSWQPIEARFQARDGGYVNQANLMKLAVSGERAGLRLESHGQSLGWLPESLGWSEADGGWQALAAPLPAGQAAPGALDRDGQRVVYTGGWTDPGLNEWVDVLPGGVEHSLVLEKAPVAQAGARPEWLALRARLRLPAGAQVWAEGAVQTDAFETGSQVEVRSEQGELLLVVAAARAFEQGRPEAGAGGRYRFSPPEQGQDWQVEVLTPWTWWQAAGRQYPAVLDPPMFVYQPMQVTSYSNTAELCSWPAPPGYDQDTGSVGLYGVIGMIKACPEKRFRMAVRFPSENFPTFPTGYTIQDSELIVVPVSGYYWPETLPNGEVVYNGPRANVTMRRLLSDWDQNTGFFSYSPDNSQPIEHEMKVLNPANRNPNAGYMRSRFQLPAEWLQGWIADPSSNHGVMFNLSDEGSAADTLFIVPAFGNWTDEDKQYGGNGGNSYISQAGGFMLQLNYSYPPLAEGAVIESPLPSPLGDLGSTDHYYSLAVNDDPAWQAIAVKGIREVPKPGHGVELQAAGNPIVGLNDTRSDGEYDEKSNFILYSDQNQFHFDTFVPAFNPSSTPAPAYYRIERRASQAFGGGGSLAAGSLITETFAMSTTQNVAIYALNLVAGTNVNIAFSSTSLTKPVLRLYPPQGGEDVIYTKAKSAYRGLNITIPSNKTRSGAWALVVEHEGDLTWPETPGEVDIYTLRGTLQVTACAGNETYVQGQGCMSVQDPPPTDPDHCKMVGPYSVHTYQQVFNINPLGGFTTHEGIAYIGNSCSGTPSRLVMLVNSPIFLNPATNSLMIDLDTPNPYTPQASLIRWVAGQDPTIFPVWTSEWTAYPVSGNSDYGKLRPWQEKQVSSPLNDADRETQVVRIDVGGQNVHYAATIQRKVNAQEITNPAAVQEYSFSLGWNVQAEGYSNSTSYPLTYGSGPDTAELGTLEIRVNDHNQWRMDYVYDGFSGMFEELRVQSKAVLPDELGAAWKPVQLVIQTTSKPYAANGEPSNSKNCPNKCLDVRSPLDGVNNLRREFDLPDITITGAAKTVVYSQPGELQVFSADHPEAAEAVSLPFSFRTFNTVVTVNRGVCPGSSVETTIFNADGNIALPGIGSDTDMGPKLHATFTVCGSMLDQLKIDLENLPIPVGTTGLFITGLHGEFHQLPAGTSSISLGIDYAMEANGSITNGTGTVTIDTGGLFDASVDGTLAALLNYQGRAWVAWNPLDMGMSVSGGMSLWILHIQASVGAHAWRGQGWQHMYSWLPDDGAMHVAASLGASVVIPDAELWDEWPISIPDGDWELVSLGMLFGQFHAGCGGCYQWGVQATVSHWLYTLGFDVGVYLGFPDTVDIILGSSDHRLVDQPPARPEAEAGLADDGQASTTLSLPTLEDALNIANAATVEPYTMYIGGQPVETERLIYPNPGAPTAVWPITVTAGTEGLLVGLGWQDLAADPHLTLIRPGDHAEFSATNTAAGVRFSERGVRIPNTESGTPPNQSSEITVRIMASVEDPVAGVWQARIDNATATDQWHLSYALNGNSPSLALTNPSVSSQPWVNSDPYPVRWTVEAQNNDPGRLAVSLFYTVTLASGAQRGGPIGQDIDYGLGVYNWDMRNLPAGRYQVWGQLAAPLTSGRLAHYQNGAKDVWLTPGKSFLAPGNITLSDAGVPAKPATPTLTPLNEAFKACWTPNQDKDLEGYQLQWTAPNIDNTPVVHDLNVRATVGYNPGGMLAWSQCARISGLNAGLAVTAVRVRAYDTSGRFGPWSDTITGTPQTGIVETAPDPGTLSFLGVTTGRGMRLSWTGAAAGVAGYLVYYGLDSHAGPDNRISGALGGSSPIDVGNVKNYTVNGLDAGRLGYFRVQAYDAAGRLSKLSNEVSHWVTNGQSSDGDTTPDDWELYWGISEKELDPDNDGIPSACQGIADHYCEYYLGTNPYELDSDHDGYTDGQEVSDHTNPNDAGSTPRTPRQPWLLLDKHYLGFAAGTLGAPPHEQIIHAYNAFGGLPLNLTVASSAKWLDASIRNGRLSVSVNPSGLQSGRYVGKVTVSAAAGATIANAPQIVTVVLLVYRGQLYNYEMFLPVMGNY